MPVYSYELNENPSYVFQLIKQKLQPVSVMCANESKLTVLPNKEKLDITLKNILPSPGWVPPDTAEGVSEHRGGVRDLKMSEKHKQTSIKQKQTS